MLSKEHYKIVKRPPGNESISFCCIAVHTRQLLIACQKKKVKFNLNLKCFTILLQMIYESNHAATTISSCIQVRNWGKKKLCYLLPITKEENCSEEKSRRKKNQTEKDLYSRNLQLKQSYQCLLCFLLYSKQCCLAVQSSAYHSRRIQSMMGQSSPTSSLVHLRLLETQVKFQWLSVIECLQCWFLLLVYYVGEYELLKYAVHCYKMLSQLQKFLGFPVSQINNHVVLLIVQSRIISLYDCNVLTLYRSQICPKTNLYLPYY